MESKNEFLSISKIKAVLEFQSAYTSITTELSFLNKDLFENREVNRQMEEAILPILKKYFVKHDQLSLFINEEDINWFASTKVENLKLHSDITKFQINRFNSEHRIWSELLRINKLKEKVIDEGSKKMYVFLKSTFKKELESDSSTL